MNFKFQFKQLVRLVLLVGLWNVAFCATTYYVSTDGNNSWNGLYPEYQGNNDGPVRTIDQGVTLASAGDTVKVLEGTYTRSTTLDIDKSITLEGEFTEVDGEITLKAILKYTGSSDAIEITGSGNATTIQYFFVRLDCQGGTPAYNGIKCNSNTKPNFTSVKIDGEDSSNPGDDSKYPEHGIYVDNPGDDVRIVCDISSTDMGLYLTQAGDDYLIYITGSVFEDCDRAIIITEVRHFEVEASNFLLNKKAVSISDSDFQASTSGRIEGCTFQGMTNGVISTTRYVIVDIISCDFNDNTNDGRGGAINNKGGTKLYNCTFEDNQSYIDSSVYTMGGAIYNEGSMSIYRCEFLDNSAYNTQNWNYLGGAIYNDYNYYNGGIYIFDSIFQGNSAAKGGAIYSEDNLYVYGCWFVLNQADLEGGAIFNGANRYKTHYVSNIFQANYAKNSGGAIYSDTSDDDIGTGNEAEKIINCTFVDNDTSGHNSGNAVYVNVETTKDNNVWVANCILWDNGNSNPILASDASTGFVTHCDIEGGFGTGNIDVNPGFVSTPSDGGDGWIDDPNTIPNEAANNNYGDLRLQSDSLLITSTSNKGDIDEIPDDLADININYFTDEPVPFDFNLARRIQGDDVEMGAFEGPAADYYVNGSSGNDNNNGLTWDTAFATIQKAVDTAGEDDVIECFRTTYTENIDVINKNLIIRSQPNPWMSTPYCTIDGGGGTYGIKFSGSVDDSTILEGFRITNSQWGVDVINGASPVIYACDIYGNQVGIYALVTAPTISNCRIYSNSGYNIAIAGSGAKIFNSSIIAAGTYGISLLSSDSTTLIYNNTIINNSNGSSTGHGIYASNSNPTITNCILWGNDTGLSGCSATYSCGQVSAGGTGNTTQDPNFVTGTSYLSDTSPCKNTGTNTVLTSMYGWPIDILRSPRKIDGPLQNDDYVDMGYHEYYTETNPGHWEYDN